MGSRRVWAETFPSLPRSRSSCRTCPSAGEAVQANAAASIRKRIRGMLGPWPTRLAVRPVGRAPLTVFIRGWRSLPPMTVSRPRRKVAWQRAEERMYREQWQQQRWREDLERRHRRKRVQLAKSALREGGGDRAQGGRALPETSGGGEAGREGGGREMAALGLLRPRRSRRHAARFRGGKALWIGTRPSYL